MSQQLRAVFLFFILTVLVSEGSLFAQSVGIGTTSPNASALLDLTDTSGGILVPRMTMAQRNAIATPATGLFIYQTDNTPAYYYYNSAAWVPFVTVATGWSTGGNSGTSVPTNFLGTTDLNDFRLRTNNIDQVAFTTRGYVGIGQLAPGRPLEAVKDNATDYSAAFRSATSETGVLVGSKNNASTYGALQAFKFSNGTKVVEDLALQPNCPGAKPGKVGVSTNNALPTTKFDINGDLAIRRYDTTAVNNTGGATNNNYDVRGHSFVRITGPTTGFTITGIAGGKDGRIVMLYNATPTVSSSTGQPMTISNDNASSSPANRIYTLTGADIVTTHNATVSMIYSSSEQRWIVFAVKP